MPPIFIINSGRCGSTMMSNLINRHPDVLSISELLINITDFCKSIDGAFPSGEIDGREFWRMQSLIIPEITTMIRHGIHYSELLYPFDSPGAKFNRDTGVPAIMMAALPHLTADHDRLYDALEQHVIQQSRASLRSHYDGMFGWLAQRFGKKTWVERSGGSTYIFPQIYALYPDALYIHIVRDGVPTALSMSQHSGYRLLLINEKLRSVLGVNPYESDDRSMVAELPEELKQLLPENFNRDAFDAIDFPLEFFGASWSDHVRMGFELMDTVPPEQVLTVHYESFCANPAAQLERLVSFIGVGHDPDWLAETTQLVRVGKTNSDAVSKDEMTRLVDACRPGMDLIQRKVAEGIIPV